MNQNNNEESCITSRFPWSYIRITPESYLFFIVQQKLKDVKFDQKTKDFEVINKDRSNKLRQLVKDQYKLVLEWQDETQFSVDLFRKEVEDEPAV